MKPARILILSASHLCRNPRALKEATALGEAGHEVTVLTVSVDPQKEVLDAGLVRDRPFRREIIDYAARDGRARVAYFLQRAVTVLARRATRHLGFESARALGPAGALLRRARRHGSDLVIAHTEVPLWVASRLAREGRRVAADLEDWYSEDLLPADRVGRPRGLLRAAERFALHEGRYVSVPSACMAEALVAAFGSRRPVVVRNSFPLQPRPRTDDPAAAPRPRFVWFSQTIGPGRGLEEFLPAWGRSRRPSELHLLGEPRADFARAVPGLVPPERRGDIHWQDPVTPEALPGMLARFDLGLALESAAPPNRDLAVTNKILQYLNAGLAVIATETRGQREVLAAAPACGRIVDLRNPASAAEQIDDLLAHPAVLLAHQRAARAAAEREFCWEHDRPRLLAAVATALAEPASASR